MDVCVHAEVSLGLKDSMALWLETEARRDVLASLLHVQLLLAHCAPAQAPHMQCVPLRCLSSECLPYLFPCFSDVFI